MKSPSVWHLSSNRWNSAITEYALSCAKALQNAGFASLFSSLAGSPGATRAKQSGLACAELGHVDWRDYARAKQLMRQFKPSYVFTYGGPETALAQLLPQKNIKLIRVRGQAIDKTRWFRQRHWLAHRRVAHLIAPSARLAADLTAHTGRHVESVILGCDTRRFFRTTKSSAAMRPELVVLGRLDPVKGHGVMMGLHRRILGIWPEDRPAPLLHIVGQPANLSVSDLQTIAAEHGLVLDRDWRLTPTRVENVAALMSQAAIGVVPSTGSEIICRTAEEFLLCGTPVAVSGVGSLNEVLFPGAGVSYYGVDQEQAALLIRDLVLSSLLETEAAKVERARRAAALFSLEAMAARLQTILD